MRRIILTSIVFLISITIVMASGEKKSPRLKNDTANYIEILGKIVDSKSADPIIFATVVVKGTSIATVTNTDGEFILKVPKGKETGALTFAHLGYQNSEKSISDLNGGKNHIKLERSSMPIPEVVVSSNEALQLIREAMTLVPKNYSETAEMQTAFYRETIKQNKNYVAVSEAVLDVYKSSYRPSFDADRVRIYKGRKSRNVKKMDTLVVKLQGGPRTSLMLDIVKNPGDLLQSDVFKYYKFDLSGVTSIDNRDTYVINFDQLDNVEYPLYSGNIYIDVETKAFAGMDFGLSEKGLPYAADVLVKKKPGNLKIDILKGHYLVRYRKEGDKWYINYVRSELSMDSKWKRKLFKSNYHVMLEMAVTDRNQDQVEKIPAKESVKSSDIFAENVNSFEDENYWGDYNTIKPDESIESAIKKLNKKLKRK